MNNELEKEPFPHLKPPFSFEETLRIIRSEHSFIHWTAKNAKEPKAKAFGEALDSAMKQNMLLVMKAIAEARITALQKRAKSAK
ncbi:MAG: hypothetical protein IT416_00900 [Candidatus Pacebacteria bacterium]|nr:hypothetical protein [Candidatus Paceibacterota bacterium]